MSVFTINLFHKFLNTVLMFRCNERIEMNKLLCSLACTLITIIDSNFIALDVSLV